MQLQLIYWVKIWLRHLLERMRAQDFELAQLDRNVGDVCHNDGIPRTELTDWIGFEELTVAGPGTELT